MRRHRRLAFAAALAYLAVACTSVPPAATAVPAPGGSGPVPSATPSPGARRGGTFVDVTIGGDALTMQPLSAADSASNERIALMFEGLRTRDPLTLEFRPALASGWALAPDGRSVTYTLREAAWSDGVPITSADYRWTWEALLDPRTRAPARGLVGALDGPPEAPDPRTLIFTFRSASAMAFLLTDIVPAVPRHLFEGHDLGEDFPRPEDSVGSGPFVLREWAKGDHATFVANERYWRGRPYLDRYVFRVVKDAASAYRALKAGEVDTAPIAPQDWEEAQRLPEIYTLGYYYYAATWDYLGFNLRNPILQDARVRRAIALALDKAAMIGRILFGHAQEQASIYPVGSPVVTEEAPRLGHDPEAARRLLADAGWTAGADGLLAKADGAFQLRLHYSAGSRLAEQVAAAVRADLREVGIALELVPEEFNALMARLRAGRDFDLFLLNWSGGADPDSARSIWTTGGTQNFTGYANPEVDRLFAEGDAVFDLGERKLIYARIQQILAEDQPYVFLWTRETLIGFNKRIVGPRPVPYGTRETKWNVHEWYSATGK